MINLSVQEEYFKISEDSEEFKPFLVVGRLLAQASLFNSSLMEIKIPLGKNQAVTTVKIDTTKLVCYKDYLYLQYYDCEVESNKRRVLINYDTRHYNNLVSSISVLSLNNYDCCALLGIYFPDSEVEANEFCGGHSQKNNK